MEDDAPVIYGLEFQARALTPMPAEHDCIRFLVGTQSLRFDNQVHQIDFDDENNVINKNVFLHKEGEIWDISASPLNKQVFATVYNKASETKAVLKASLWQLPNDYELEKSEESSSSVPSLEKLADFDCPDIGDIKSIIWHPSGENTEVISITETQIILWDGEANGSTLKQISSAVIEGKGHPKLTAGAWNPHHNSTQIATANETCIRGWDVRSMKQVYCIENAHGQLVRDLDFNPNKQYYLASCGDDCKAKFWDIRNSTQPLKILSDHSHWIWKIRYNHFHDQLVLTSSSDSRVILNNAESISSEPYGHLIDDEEDDDENELDSSKREKSTEPMKDGVISTYEEHEDSVYTVQWSTVDPWLFASLSYDGRLVINRVPRATKYKIMI